MCGSGNAPGLFEGLKRRNIPAIMVVRPLNDPDFDFVGTDNFLGTQMATEHLLRMGHRHIAFIGGSQNSGSRAQRIGGFTSKLLEYGVTPNPARSEPLTPAKATARAWQRRYFSSIHTSVRRFAIRMLWRWGDAKLTQDGP